MNKTLQISILMTGLAASLVLPTALAINAFDVLDHNSDEYIDTRLVEVGQGNGQIDLSTLPYVQPPMRLELVLHNSSVNPVNVQIPELGVSYLVQSTSDRIAYLSMLQVGRHQKVDFTSDPIIARQNVVMDTSSIDYILSSGYNQPVVEETRTETKTVNTTRPVPTNNAVRGYW